MNLHSLGIFFFRPHGEYDAHKSMLRSHHASDGEESAKIMSSSVPLSVLLIPSLKEVNSYIYFIHNISKQRVSVKLYYDFLSF